MKWIRPYMVWLIGNMLESYEKSGRFKKMLMSAMVHMVPGQMSCREFNDFIMSYVDETMDERVRTHFEFHLDSCFMCRKLLDDYVTTISMTGLVREDGPPQAPRELVDAAIAAALEGSRPDGQ